MPAVPPIDFASALRIAFAAIGLALVPLGWVWLRSRGADRRGRLAALTALAMFLCFDLIVFGAFTRLTDSGLGCPDWPGCYGEASPLGASEDIAAAEAAHPSGPVTWSKAWIEMIHRYLAMTVGLLIVVLAAASWAERDRLPHALGWPLATLAWVVLQGLAGKYTVTMKLYPSVVTLHLLGGIGLLVLLAWQHEGYRDRPFALSAGLHAGAAATAVLLLVQIAPGGWVCANYAVLACGGFPRCNGHWWPPMDFGQGFTLLRELGRAGHGGYLELPALVAIHMAHRLVAIAAFAALVALAVALVRRPRCRRYGGALGALALLQVATGLSNVVLGWPIVAAILHSAGAAALVLALALLLARARRPDFGAERAAGARPLAA